MKIENTLEELLDAVKIPSDREVEAAGLRFDKRIRRVKLRRRIIWYSSSAAAILLLGIIITSLWTNDDERKVVEVARVIDVNHNIAEPTLILSDGNSVNLKKEEIDKTISGSNIQVADNHITYDSISDTRETKYNTLVIPVGYTYDITLADGTQVTLNAGSSLKYPVEFTGDTREVELSGEAYFNVTKSGKPFEVSVAGSKIRVYGTRFNVKSSRQNSVETVLVEGKIGFKSPGRDEIQVVPGELVAFDAGSGHVEVRKVDTGYATAWKNGVFKYRDRKLNFVLEDISAWYGVDFESQVDATAIELTMNLSKKTPIDEVISFMELMTNCKFIKERGKYIIK